MFSLYFKSSCSVIALSALGALSLASAASAQAALPASSAVTPGTQTTAVPAGTVPIVRQQGAAVARDRVQAVGGQGLSNTVQTAKTTGVLGDDGLPDITSSGPGNVAGLLAYCVQNKIGSGQVARVVGRSLSKRGDVQSDQFYSLGGQGLLQTSSKETFDVSTLSPMSRVKLCSKLAMRGQEFGSDRAKTTAK